MRRSCRSASVEYGRGGGARCPKRESTEYSCSRIHASATKGLRLMAAALTQESPSAKACVAVASSIAQLSHESAFVNASPVAVSSVPAVSASFKRRVTKPRIRSR